MRDAIVLRPAVEDDIPFLFRLYASTRDAEMQTVPWTDEEKHAFVDMQFRAQKAHYETYYCDAEHLIIEKDGIPIGRLYIDRDSKDIRIVDIAIVPEQRGNGVGTVLLEEILSEGAASSRTVSIHVEHYNPARRLYERLGFREIETNGIYHLMEWCSAT